MGEANLTAVMVEGERYKRQTMLWGKEGQEKLQASRVTVIGLDSQGLYAALCLAALGVGNISLVDGNPVKSGENFLGIPVERGSRATSYAPLINLVNPQISVEGYPTNLESRIDTDIMHKSTVVLETTNNIRSKELAIGYSWKEGIPVLSTSSKPGYTKTMFCDPQKKDVAYLMPMFEGFPQDELLGVLKCGVLTEEVRKLIFNEKELLKDPVRYKLGKGYRFSAPNRGGEFVTPDLNLYRGLSVAFFGGGALGCWGSVPVAKMGFGRADVFDYDVFESHNINRQILGFDGIGKLKAPHIAQKIEAMSGGRTKSEGFNVMILPGFKTERKYDLIFDFVDNAYTRALNTAFAITNGIPMISAGALPFSARTITQVDGKTQCLNCIYDIYNDGKREEMIRRASCAANPNPSVVMSNAVGAAMALLESYTVFEPEKFGQAFNGELTYRSTTPRRFGTNELNVPCNCYTTKPVPDLTINDEDVKKFAEQNAGALLEQR